MTEDTDIDSFLAGMEFARRLDEFRYDIDQQASTLGSGYPCQPGRCSAPPLAKALGVLLDHLGVAEVPATRAMIDAYDAAHALHIGAAAERYGRSAEQRAEAARRHELAVTVECPYCGSQPGAPCRSAGPNGKGYSKGIDDHKDRWRAAEHLFPPAREERLDALAMNGGPVAPDHERGPWDVAALHAELFGKPEGLDL